MSPLYPMLWSPTNLNHIHQNYRAKVRCVAVRTFILFADGQSVTIVVLSRLAYRKGIDLLIATAPRICASFPNVNFIIGIILSVNACISHLSIYPGGDGPKLIELLQMREKHRLQDRIELLGSVRHEDVSSVSEFWTYGFVLLICWPGIRY